MSDATSPMQRSISLFILGPQGFISGMLHLPDLSGLHTFLNAPVEILELTDVVLPGSSQTFPFMAMQKAAMHLLDPMETLEFEVVYMNTTRRPVTWLLSFGCIRDYIEMLANVRILDFLIRTTKVSSHSRTAITAWVCG